MDDTETKSAPEGWWRRVTGWIEPDANPQAQVYGTLTMGALLAVESTRRETFLDAAGSVALAVVLYWLAHAYSAALGERLEGTARWSPRHLFDVAVGEWALLRGALVPLIVLLITGASGAATSTAVIAALISAAALIFLLEVIAGLRGRLRGAEVVFEIVISAVLGLGILALKVIAH